MRAEVLHPCPFCRCLDDDRVEFDPRLGPHPVVLAVERAWTALLEEDRRAGRPRWHPSDEKRRRRLEAS